ncbi:cucumisin-like [Chenopodium quinoa]|uniref:cucumisin-like n=1 Tax=Chenopodium quinoa TaxID=63459 RepID=UPI000B786DFD|nr:cucumisin-like [Chenopodium quinoa]
MTSKLFPYYSYVNISLIIFLLWLQTPIIQAHDEHQRKTYIIYMGDRHYSNISAKDFYLDMLSGILESVPSENTSDYLLYTYENFQGCVAKLTEDEAKKASRMNGVVSVFPNRKKKLHTTRSWDFMGFSQDVERSAMESDITIGVLDSGIWPESESFQDKGFGPPPSKWKGICQTSNDNFTCNNKIIGARYFRADGEIPEGDIASPRDTIGHGTHCASIAAGGVVNKASFLGLGQGTARGGVPSARIAVYKVCWTDDCWEADIMAAFDAAISDGVDVISISLGSEEALPYFEDTIAIGAFHAMKHGVLTSSSAGNSGPSLHTLGNIAPWLLSVGASIIDRKFTTQVKLGNGMAIEGVSLNTFEDDDKTFPLIYGGDAANKSYEEPLLSRYCLLDTLNKTLVKGKIVICDLLVPGEEPFLGGAAGVIMQDVEPHDHASSFPLPASYIRVDDAARVISYTRNLTSSTPIGTIKRSVQVEDTPAPFVVSFSSRGPNPISPGILKPDLTAPGESILAAYSPVASPSGVMGDQRSVKYSIESGTSMACPHATAVAAYVKSFHPTWSEAAIKSALMTTALPMSSATNEEAELAYGSGQINPLKAIDPGLVYDVGVSDYMKFLCSHGYNETAIRFITGESSCGHKRSTNWDLNYPSIALPTSLGPFDTVFTRTVTNVGSPNSTYKAIVTVPRDQPIVIKVQPSVLSFKSAGEKLSFKVRVYGTIGMRALISSSLVWDDGQHQVRSPIVVFNLS